MYLARVHFIFENFNLQLTNVNVICASDRYKLKITETPHLHQQFEESKGSQAQVRVSWPARFNRVVAFAFI